MGTHPAEWAFYGAFRGSGLQNGLCKARTEVQFDAATGLASWYIRVVDAAKRAAGDGECWPDDPDAGVLNPNVTVPEGEGYITYRVRVREDAPGNARIDNSASIVFDYNPPIVTDPAWWNTVYETESIPVTIDGVTTNMTFVVGEPYGERRRAGHRLAGDHFRPRALRALGRCAVSLRGTAGFRRSYGGGDRVQRLSRRRGGSAEGYDPGQGRQGEARQEVRQGPGGDQEGRLDGHHD